MFSSRRRARKVHVPAPPPPDPEPQTTPHHVPAWLESWPVPVKLAGSLADPLLDTHRRLILAATTGPGEKQYLAAAEVVSRLLTEVSFRRVAAGPVCLREPVERSLTEIVTVLRTWSTNTHPRQVFHRFNLARAWAEHAEQIVAAAATAGYRQHPTPEPIS